MLYRTTFECKAFWSLTSFLVQTQLDITVKQTVENLLSHGGIL